MLLLAPSSSAALTFYASRSCSCVCLAFTHSHTCVQARGVEDELR